MIEHLAILLYPFFLVAVALASGIVWLEKRERIRNEERLLDKMDARITRLLNNRSRS